MICVTNPIMRPTSQTRLRKNPKEGKYVQGQQIYIFKIIAKNLDTLKEIIIYHNKTKQGI